MFNPLTIESLNIKFLKKFKRLAKTSWIVHLLEVLDPGAGATVVTVGLLSAALDGPGTITSLSAPEVKKFVPSGCYEVT